MAFTSSSDALAHMDVTAAVDGRAPEAHEFSKNIRTRPSFHARFSGEFSLCVLNQFFDALRIGFAVAMAADGIAAAGGFNEDIGPYEPCPDMNGGDFGNAHTFLVLAEQGSLAAGDGFVAHLDVSPEEQVAFGPSARFEGLDRHAVK